MKIIESAFAGTLESSDLMIRVMPAEQNEITIELNSSVLKQFGETIELVIRDTLEKMNVSCAHLIVDDKGALDCVIRARVQAAVMRACALKEIDWSKMQ